MRHIEVRRGAERIDYHGVDIRFREGLYRRDDWSSLQLGDLTEGLPCLESDQFDVVICEQVLEHVAELDVAIAALARVLRPGGLLIVGVPIFPPGVDQVRKHLVPVWDRMAGVQKKRGHVQAFTKRTFVRALCRHADVEVRAVRGFRIVSGGMLRGLENYRWWWRLSRAAGALVPSLAIEIQVLAVKRGGAGPEGLESVAWEGALVGAGAD
jgi:SAM-dependent methyltransferase